MAQQIGTVAKLQGVVYARAEDGTQRQLQLGDAVFQGEVLITGPGAVLELAVADAPAIVMPGGRELLLSGDLLSETRDTATDASVVDDTIASIVDTLANGGDILDNIEAPAAGRSTQDEGSSFVRLGRIGFDLPEFATLGTGVDADRVNLDDASVDNDLQLLLPDDDVDSEAPGVPPSEPPIAGPGPAPEPAPPVNLAPVAEPDGFSGQFASVITGNVLDNDSDPEADALEVTGNTAPENGTVVVNADGSFFYEPNEGFSGEDRFEYTITDENGNTDTTEVLITVAEEAPTPPPVTPPVTPPVAPPPPPANVAPTAGDDSQTLSEDTPITLSVLANDSDSDGSLVLASVTVIGGPANGSVNVNGDGTVTYTPNPNYTGADSFTYTVTDDDGAVSNVATVNLTVSAVDDAPVSVDLGPQSNEDAQVVSLDVSGNFSDVDSALTFTASGLPAGLSIDPVSGVISGTLGSSASQGGANGVYAVIVTASDGVNPPVSESFDWSVSNPSPEALDDSQGAAEDTAVDISVLANDSDADGDLLSIQSFTQPANGTVTDNGDGTLRYIPNTDYSGADSFTYTVTDGEGGTSTATVNLTIAPENDPPVSVDLDPQSSADAEAVSVDLSGSFSDVDSTLTYSATGLPAGLSIDPATGVISGTVDNSASQGGTSGVYNVTVTATDGVNTPVSESFDWTVMNPGPTANDDTGSTDEDTAVSFTPVQLLGNDSDPDGDELTIQSVGAATNGTVVLNGDGTVTFTPDADYNGTASFEYTITDDEGGTDTATVNLTVDGVNDPPVVATPLGTQSNSDADAITPVDVSSAFSDVDSTLTYSATGLPTGLSIDPATGVISGTIDNSASQGGTAGVYNVTVTASDGVNPPVSESFDWTVTNPGPTAVDDDGGSTNEDTAATFAAADLLGNDTDPDGDTLSITGVSSPENGTVVLNGDGTVTFTPDADYNGTASFEYTITDSEGGTDTAIVNLTVNPVNDPPVVIGTLDAQNNLDADSVTSFDASTPFADIDSTLTYSATGLPTGLSIDPDTGVISGTIDNSASQDGTSGVYNVTVTATDGVNTPVSESFDWTVTNPGPTAVDDDGGLINEDTAATFAAADLLANDTDPDGDTLSITAVSSPENGTVVLNGDGTVTFTPDADYNGPASFEYTITDSEGGTDTAIVNLTVNPVNDPPVVIGTLAAQSNLDADSVTSVDASTPFADIDSALTYSATGLPTGLSIDPATGVISGTIDNSASQGGTSGVYNVTVTATDGVNTPVSESFDWTVTNPGPTAVDDDGGSTNEDTAATFAVADLLANDTDPDGDTLSITAVSSPTNGTVVLNGNGTITFTPTPDYSGPASFEYTITDDEGGTATATVNLTVDAVNDPPVVIGTLGAQNSLDADAIGPLDVSTAFEDVDSTLTYSATGLPTGLSIDPDTGVISGTLDNSASQGGTAGVYNVTVTASDGVNPPVSESFDWTVTNPGPTAVDDDGGSTNEDTAATFAAADLLGNDTDPDGDTLSITGVSSPENGTVVLNGDGTVTFTPDADYSGPASFEYTITDGEGGTETAIVNLTVNPVNDPPVVIGTLDAQNNLDADSVTSVDASTPFADIDSTLTYSATGLPAGLSIDPDTGMITGTIDNSASQGGTSGVYNVTVTATDGVNPPVSESFDWTVTNPGPTAVDDDGGSTNEDTAATFAAADLLANDTDPDGDTLSITGVSSPTNGTVVLNGDGTVTFTPDADYSGPASFEYTITDDEGGTSTATVSLTVTADNDPPVALDDTYSVLENTTLTVDGNVFDGVLENDSDTEGSLTVTSTPVTDVANGTLQLNTDGTFVYTPNANFEGEDTFTYEVTDSDGATAEATVTITVLPENEPPLAVDDSDEVLLMTESSTSGDVLINDSDPDSGPAPIEVLSPGTIAGNYGDLLLNQDGSYVYTVDPDRTDEALLGPADGLVAYWKFDAADSSTVADDAPTGSATNVSLNGNPLVAGKIGNAVEFDGTSRATMPNSGEINLGTFDERTISLHFNAADTDGRQVIYEEGGGVRGLNIYLEGGELFVGGWNRQESGWNGDWISLGTVTAGEWNHVALVLDGGPTVAPNALTGFLNGVEVGSVPGSQIWPHSGDISIGGSGGNSRYDGGGQSNAANLFSGQIDDVRVYNSVLDDQDISALSDQDGTLIETFDYQVTDGEDNSNTAQLEITLRSGAAPDAQPLAVNDSFVTNENEGLTSLNVLGNDTLADNASVLSFDAATTGGGTVTQNADGTFNYVPAAGFSGSDTFSYTLRDDDGDTSTATVTVTVNPVVPVNDPPVAGDDSYSVLEDGTLTVTDAVNLGVLANDSDLNGDNLTVATTPVADVQNGTLILAEDGTFTYTPNTGFVGDDTFTYAVSDGNGGTAEATVTITVDPVNNPPESTALNAQTSDDADAVTLDVSGNFTDSDSALTYTATGLPPGLTIDPSTGIISGTVDSSASQGGTNGGSNGVYTVAVTATEVGGTASTTQSFDWTVSNPAPDAVDDFTVTELNTAVDIDVLADNGSGLDSDPDGDILTIDAFDMTSANGGTIAQNSDGTLNYTPAADFSGQDTFTYVVSDGDGGSDTATVTINVRAPYATALGSFGSDGWNDMDSNGNAVTIEALAADGTPGTVSFESNFRLGVAEQARGSNGAVPEQLQYDAVTGQSETLIFRFTGYMDEAEVRISNLIPGEGDGELGRWFATRDGVAVAEGDISGSSVTINTGGSTFNELTFIALPYVDTSLETDNDSSDYFVSGIRGSGPASGQSSVPPIALDLDDDGVEYLSREAGVVFTDLQSGESVSTAWVAPDDGMLVFDANESGTIDESKEYVFTEWSENATTDMEAVAEVFDTNSNNKLDPGDEAWSQFSVWQDANSDGVSDAGELMSLDELGVDSIDLTYAKDSVSGIAADGDVTIYGQSEVTWTDGSVSTAEDASFAIDIADVIGDDGEVTLPLSAENAGSTVESTVDRSAAAPNAEQSVPGDGAAALAALEVDLLLNVTRDDKPDSGIVD